MRNQKLSNRGNIRSIPHNPGRRTTPPSAQPGCTRAPSAPHSVKRGAFDRMKKIYGWLTDEAYPNCTRIAADLEISTKTAARDVDFMRDRWNLPIAYDEKRHGFHFTEKIDRLPWVPITEAELFAVCISHKVLDLYQGMPFHKPLQLAFQKLTNSLDDEERYTLQNLEPAFSFRPFAPEDPDLRLLELVTRAIASRRSLKFAYRKPGEKCSQARKVHPYHVTEFEGRLYLLAHDTHRRAVRTFVLARMTNAALAASTFVVPPGFDPAKQFSSSLGVMSGTGDYHVVIEMDPWLTDILRGRRLHHTQAITELSGGGSHLRLRLSSLEEIQQHVLSWGKPATALEPLCLRQRILQTVEELSQRYAPHAVPSRAWEPTPGTA